MRRYLIVAFFHLTLFASSQPIQHDWENYIMSVDGKPVSVNVDLGLAPVAPLKERTFVIILRIKLKNADTKGMPYPDEYAVLLNMEDSLIAELGKETGAIFTGRFTQRGIREFYFYAPDTIGYAKGANMAMKNFLDYAWLSKAKEDVKWENYFTVLYPSELELLKIKSRREIGKIDNDDNSQRKTVSVHHFFSFLSFHDRDQFLRNLSWTGFEIISMPEDVDFKTNKFLLELERKAIPDLIWIEQFIVPLYRSAQKYGGKYLSWRTGG